MSSSEWKKVLAEKCIGESFRNKRVISEFNTRDNSLFISVAKESGHGSDNYDNTLV